MLHGAGYIDDCSCLSSGCQAGCGYLVQHSQPAWLAVRGKHLFWSSRAHLKLWGTHLKVTQLLVVGTAGPSLMKDIIIRDVIGVQGGELENCLHAGKKKVS